MKKLTCCVLGDGGSFADRVDRQSVANFFTKLITKKKLTRFGFSFEGYCYNVVFRLKKFFPEVEGYVAPGEKLMEECDFMLCMLRDEGLFLIPNIKNLFNLDI